MWETRTAAAAVRPGWVSAVDCTWWLSAAGGCIPPESHAKGAQRKNEASHAFDGQSDASCLPPSPLRRLRRPIRLCTAWEKGHAMHVHELRKSIDLIGLLTWMQMVSSEIMLPAFGPTTVAPRIFPPEFFWTVILANPLVMPSHLHRSTSASWRCSVFGAQSNEQTTVFFGESQQHACQKRVEKEKPFFRVRFIVTTPNATDCTSCSSPLLQSPSHRNG